METEFRFVVLDFGHPMNNNTMKCIINSLEEVLALSLTFSRCDEEAYFGISFLNSDFTILQSESYIRKNYSLLQKNLNVLSKKMDASNKVTVPKYKHYLTNSIDMILRVSQEKFKTENFYQKTLQVKVAIVTKKTASILVDILTDVTKKLFENFSNATLRQEYTVVQISNEGEGTDNGSSKENAHIKWTSCSDGTHNLTYFFKDWYLNRPQELHILLSKDLNCVLRCDIEDFIVNPIPISFDGRYNLLNSLRSKASRKDSSLGISKPVHNLEIVNRIPVNSLCPTLVFGIPRCIRAIRLASSWVESQMNLKMFTELCRELDRTKQGLLTKSVSKTATGELISFQFLTSDGFMLLLNDVTPDELYLPKRVELPKPDSKDDESAASFVKSCIENIPFLEEYSPQNFTSGLSAYLNHHLTETERNKNAFGSFDSNGELLEKKGRKPRSPTWRNNSEGGKCSQPKKRGKPNPEKEFKNTHPALLSPEIVRKYRRVRSGAFNFPVLAKGHH